MATPKRHALYITGMMENPVTKPVFEEFFNALGYYPPCFLGYTGTDEQLVMDIRKLLARQLELLHSGITTPLQVQEKMAI